MTFFQEPIYYVHSPEIEKLDSGHRDEEGSRGGAAWQTQAIQQAFKKCKEPAHVFLGLKHLHLLFPTRPHPIQPANSHPAFNTQLSPPFGVFPDFPGKSQCLSSDIPDDFFF